MHESCDSFIAGCSKRMDLMKTRTLSPRLSLFCYCQQVEGGDPSHFPSSGEATPEVLGLFLGSQDKRYGHIGKSEDVEETGAPILWGEDERAGAVQAGEGAGNFITMCKYLKEGRTEPGSLQWCPVPGQEATGTNWNTVSLWILGVTYLLCRWWKNSKSCWERLWTLLLGDSQNSHAHGPCWRLGQMGSEVSATPAILQICDFYF